MDSKTKNILIKGFYKNNLPFGNWYFYNQSGLETSYNYDQKKLLFLDATLVSKSVVTINSNDNEIVEKAGIPILLYPKDLFIKQLQKNLLKQLQETRPSFILKLLQIFQTRRN